LRQSIENDRDIDSRATNMRSPATNLRVDDHPSQQRILVMGFWGVVGD
jgi:hypothetical protein